ncbi:MAG: GNAT family protein [Dermatophilaceae bacterium]
MSTDTVPFTVLGDAVEVRPPTLADSAAYAEAVTRSARRLSLFAIPDPDNLPAIVAAQSPTYRTFMVWASDPEGKHGLVGRINVANVVQGAFRSATIGYDSYDPYAGRGLFSEGLELVVGLVFADPPHGMGLHRIEANIQPTNTRSMGLVRSLGFVHEGFSRQFLHLPGPDGRRSWRDHERFAMLESDWPAAPYRHRPPRRMAVVVQSGRAWEGQPLAPALAAELGLPVFSVDVVEPALVWELLFASPIGGVVVTRAVGPELRMGLARAQFDPGVVPVIEAAFDVPKHEVTEIALRVRAAFAGV